MSNLKGSKTERNLLTAFAGESQARNRYTYFTSKARDEGFMQISAVFEETANQEKEHAKRLFKFLEGGDVQFTAAFPAGIISTTLENLLEAAKGEHHEQAVMYPEFAKTAKMEGFAQIASVFESIAVAEKQHEKQFKAFALNVEKGCVFSKEKKTTWRCRNCGYVHEGSEAPEVCPACNHPMAYFEILSENW